MVQETTYNSDLNNGVGVNIAPLQKVGLLSTNVVVAKDVANAIADQAEWHADERWWYRQGRLPSPGGAPLHLASQELTECEAETAPADSSASETIRR